MWICVQKNILGCQNVARRFYKRIVYEVNKEMKLNQIRR